MSKADELFIEMCHDILETGTNTIGEKVRPKWEDGTSAYTIKKFGVVHRYDLREEFPLITLRPVPFKSCVDEILWIFQKKSNNVNDLNSHIWDQWADESGSIGKAYGYQIGQRYMHHKIDAYKKAPDYKLYPSTIFTSNNLEISGWKVYMDQIDTVLYDLRNNPYSRRIMTNMYNHAQLSEMNLSPCAYSCTFNVTDDGGDKLVLNMILNQRSQDILVANGWNVAQYAALQMMIAQSVDMVAGEFLHIIADAHIYDRHLNIIDELIDRPTYDAPKVTLDPDIKDFYQFTPESFTVEDYTAGPQIKNIPVAV